MRTCNRRCLSVCLSVGKETSEQICLKFSGKVVNGPVKKQLNFGGDPDHGSESGYGSGSRHW